MHSHVFVDVYTIVVKAVIVKLLVMTRSVHCALSRRGSIRREFQVGWQQFEVQSTMTTNCISYKVNTYICTQCVCVCVCVCA